MSSDLKLNVRIASPSFDTPKSGRAYHNRDQNSAYSKSSTYGHNAPRSGISHPSAPNSAYLKSFNTTHVNLNSAHVSGQQSSRTNQSIGLTEEVRNLERELGEITAASTSRHEKNRLSKLEREREEQAKSQAHFKMMPCKWLTSDDVVHFNKLKEQALKNMTITSPHLNMQPQSALLRLSRSIDTDHFVIGLIHYFRMFFGTSEGHSQTRKGCLESVAGLYANVLSHRSRSLSGRLEVAYFETLHRFSFLIVTIFFAETHYRDQLHTIQPEMDRLYRGNDLYGHPRWENTPVANSLTSLLKTDTSSILQHVPGRPKTLSDMRNGTHTKSLMMTMYMNGNLGSDMSVPMVFEPMGDEMDGLRIRRIGMQ